MYLGRALERLGDAALKEQEPDIGAAFLKFAVVTKELSALMKTLVRAKPYKRNLCQHMRITEYSVLLFLMILRDARNIPVLVAFNHVFYVTVNKFSVINKNKLKKDFAKSVESIT